jgi:hypothetical protein
VGKIDSAVTGQITNTNGSYYVCIYKHHNKPIDEQQNDDHDSLFELAAEIE